MSSHSIIDKDQKRRRETVLIADDEASVGDTLSLILEAHGYRAVVARTGEEAVEQAKASAPDVLVCDIIMPGISGIDAALQVRALYPDCRIILISGTMLSTDLLDRARTDGYEFEVLAKPFHPGRLLELLRGDASVRNAS